MSLCLSWHLQYCLSSLSIYTSIPFKLRFVIPLCISKQSFLTIHLGWHSKVCSPSFVPKLSCPILYYRCDILCPLHSLPTLPSSLRPRVSYNVPREGYFVVCTVSFSRSVCLMCQCFLPLLTNALSSAAFGFPPRIAGINLLSAASFFRQVSSDSLFCVVFYLLSVSPPSLSWIIFPPPCPAWTFFSILCTVLYSLSTCVVLGRGRERVRLG